MPTWAWIFIAVIIAAVVILSTVVFIAWEAYHPGGEWD